MKGLTSLVVLYVCFNDLVSAQLPNRSALICASSSASSSINTTQVIQSAADAWVYGLPALAIEQTRNAYLSFGIPLNHVQAQPGLNTAAQRVVVRPNADTVYSTAFFDLSQGPVGLVIPNVTDRYFVAAMYDAYTNNFANPGTLLNSPAGLYTLYGPQDSSCANRTASNHTIISPTNDVWMIARFYVLNATAGSQDLETVATLQSQLYVAHTPATITTIMPAFNNVTNQAYQAFYALNQAVTDNPVETSAYNANFSSVGLIAGRSFRPTLSQANLTTAQTIGNASISAALSGPGAIRILNNGWVIPTTIGTYGNDYKARAYITNFGLGALVPEQAIYPSYIGEAPNSTNNQSYSIFFPAGEPPVNGKGFWSVTLYDSAGFFVANVLNRYSLGSRDNLTKNANGFFTIYASPNLPQSGDLRNWLPAPASPWGPVMRVYGATQSVMFGNWTYPVITPLSN